MDDRPTPEPQKASQSTQAPQVSIKPIDPAMVRYLNEQINYLSVRNSGIQNLTYYYQIYKELYNNRAKELLHFKKQGKKVVGIFCNFVPLELILAADAVPVRLCSGFQDPILPAEEILPRNFCPLIKSSYGFSLMNSPHFDLVDVLIIPTTCDGKKKLAEILADQKQTWVIEVPHTQETPQARQLWLTEIQLLKRQLERLTGNRITTKKLRAAIELLNRKRSVSRRLYELRKRTPPPIWGRDAMLVTNLALFDDVKRWTERTEALCTELENHKPVCDISLPRVMITGSPTVFPTWKVPVLIEESGGVIVTDDICTGSKEFWDPIETAHWTINDMLIGIADKYLMNTCACFTPNLVRRDRIVQFVNDFKVDGVVYHVLQACHIYGMEQQRIEKALDEINIPVLSIETDYSQEDVEQIRTRVEAFLEMVSIRKSSKPESIRQFLPPEMVKTGVSDPTVASTQTPPPVAPVASAPSPVTVGIPPAQAAAKISDITGPTQISGSQQPRLPPATQPKPQTVQAYDPTPKSSPSSTTIPAQVNDPTPSPTTTQTAQIPSTSNGRKVSEKKEDY